MAFLQLARTFSNALANGHHYDEAIAKLLSPVILACKKELEEFATPLQKALETDDLFRINSTTEQALLCGAGQQWLGQAVTKQPHTHRKLFAAAERLLATSIAKHQPRLPHNLVLLQSVMQLTDAEIGFVELALAAEHASLNFDLFGFITKTQRIRAALDELGLKNGSHAKWLLHEQGAIARSGLFENMSHKHHDLSDLLKFSKIGVSLLAEAHDTVEAMASSVLEPFLPRVAQPAPIQLAWPHLDTDTQHLQNLLGHVLRQSKANQPELGINIMLHGGPGTGTGKTEFARMLCHALAASHGAAAYSVTAKDEDGDAADRQDRPAILVLDEAEDIFQSDYNNPFAALFKGKSSEQENKAWTNNLLESNPHPVIWISNRISHLDPAYLRRFAYVLEFKNPPRSQRLAIAQQHLAPVGASADLLERLSHNNALTPAMPASSARFVNLAKDASQNTDSNIQHHIQLQLKVLDEADTLLMTRSENSHRADRAVTSEFLRRLEAFQGIFMCATNHGDLLDPALMRRFIFRLNFSPLNKIQRTQLLQELLGGTKDIPILINDCTQQRLNRLDRLTPGDYANCKKRLSCLDEHPTVEEWLDKLEQEHNVKPLMRGRVGFM